MALKQTRRSVSLNREAYDALSDAAAKRGVSQSNLVVAALKAFGVKFPDTAHQPVSVVRRARMMRERSGSKVIARVDAAKRPGLIRQQLGDQVADMCGEP